MSERLRKQCDAFNEYEALDALPQDATPVELEENGYPVVMYGERFCRMRKDDGVICGAKVQTIPLLHKHFSDVHGVDANLKPATKAGNPKREVLEAAVTFYEKLMGKPPTARPTSQKRKADDSSSSEPPKKRATKKQKELSAAPGLAASGLLRTGLNGTLSSLGQIPASFSGAYAFGNAPVLPTATAFAPVPSPHTQAGNANQGSTIRIPGPEDRPPADVAGQMLPPPRPVSTSTLVPPGTASSEPVPNPSPPTHRGPNDPAPPAMLPTGSQPPSLATPAAAPTGSQPPSLTTPALDPPPVTVPPAAPTPAAATSAAVPTAASTPAAVQDTSPPPTGPRIPYSPGTQQYIQSYNMGWDDCEREYKDQMTKYAAEKEAFAREKGQLHDARARFVGNLRNLLQLFENGLV